MRGPISIGKFEELDNLYELIHAVERKPGSKDTATVAVIAKELGVKERTARHRLQLKDQLTDHPDLAGKVD